jgi:hypothetical protein
VNGGTLTIDTTNAGGVAAGANIRFQSTLTGTTAGAEPLTLTAGTGGNVTFTGAVGGTRLGAVTINSANNVTESAGLTAASLTQSAGSGTSTLNGAVDTTGAANVTTSTITFGAGGSVTAGASSTLRADDMNLAGRPISVGANRLTLRPNTAGRVIDLGTDTAGRLGLTTAEMASVTAGVLQIGDSTNTGGVILTANTSAPAAATTLSVITGAGITQSGGTLTAPSLRLDAVSGIGTSAPRLSVNATTLAARTTTSGGVFISETDNVALGTVDGQSSISSAGDVTLVAGNAITQSAGTLTGSNVKLTASAGDIGSSGTRLSINATTLSAQASGNIFLSEADNVALGTVDGQTNLTAAGGAGTITLVAGGAITQSAGTISASGLRIEGSSAGTSGTPISTTINTLAAKATTSGGVFISDTNDVAIGSVDGLTGITSAGDVTIKAGGAITRSDGTVTGNTVTLDSETGVGASGGPIVTAATTLDVQVRTSGGIYISENDAVTISNASTASGDIEITSGGTMTVTNTTVTESSGGGKDVKLTTTLGDIDLGVVNAMGDTVTLKAAGSITNSNGSKVVDVNAETLSATAAASISLDTAVATVSSATTTTGNITLNGTQKVTLGTTDPGVSSGGDLTITNSTGLVTLGLVQSGGAMKITNDGGSIVDNDTFTPSLIAGSGATLSASGSVGTATNPLNVSVSDGLLSIAAFGTDGPISFNVSGIPADSVRRLNDPPGDTVINGRSELVKKAQETAAGQGVAAVSAAVPGQGVFEAMESQMIEVLGDPSEQIEEELKLEGEEAPVGATKEEEERRRRRQ